jgi:class 3 adenylate cyclase
MASETADVCGRCAHANGEGSRFCANCGAPLTAPEPLRQARKTLTVLFSDVTGFTSITERVDAEALREVMERYFAATQDVIERHGGRVEKFIGDAVMAVFGLPAVREDDALRALRAAVEIGQALEQVNNLIPSGLGVRLATSTGVNTGEVFVSEDGGGRPVGEVIGDAVNVAARLEAAAASGEVLLGELTFKLARDHIQAEGLDLSLKGKSEAVAAFRLLALDSSETPPNRRLSAPTVGRESESRVLADALQQAITHEACVLCTVLGVAGTGKSRLIRDAAAALKHQARVLSGRCLPYGETTIYWPLAEITCQATAIAQGAEPETAIAAIASVLSADTQPQDDESPQLAQAARLAGALGLAPLAGAPEEIPHDLLTLFAALAREGPLVAVIEDIHWAGPGLLVALEFLAARLEGMPVLIVCSARPDLTETRPSWPGQARIAHMISLSSLQDTDCARLVHELLAHGDAARALAGPVVSVAGGNPLVVEEVLAMLIDDGVLEQRAQGWQLSRAVEEIRIPPTIGAILGARLDRLSEVERRLIEAAAVVGKDFDLADLSALSGDEQLVDSLEALRDKQLIADAGGFPTDYRFHHILVRDAAYAAAPKRRRADLHERFADYLETSPNAMRGGVYGEIAGEHLERACLLRRELGAGDDELEQQAHRAAGLLEQAATRARGLSDLPAARRIYARGEMVLARTDQLRPALLTGMADANLDTGKQREGQALAREAEELATRLSAEAELPRASLIRIRADVYCGDLDLEQALVQIRDIAATLEQVGDDRAVIWGWMTIADLAGYGCRFTEAATAADRAAERARRSLRAELPYCLVGLCVTLAHSQLPAGAVRRRCEEALTLVQPGTLHAALIEARGSAMVDAIEGRFDDARVRFERATEICTRYGADVFRHLCLLDWSICEMLACEFDKARTCIVRDIDGSASLDELVLGEATAMHAYSLARLGRYEDALEQTRSARARLSPNNLEPQIWCRIATALALAGVDDLAGAERCAREALALARPTEAPIEFAGALSCLGDVLLLQDHDEARRALEESRRIYLSKGVCAEAPMILRLSDQLAAFGVGAFDG